jgi:predicted Fe-Mo cluster-binding NifX family protein
VTSRSGDDRLVRRLEGDNLHEADLCSHGLGPGAQPCHAQMAAAITEFQAFLAQGMGVGVHHGLAEAGIRLVSTGTAGIDEAVQAYLEGRLVDHRERLYCSLVERECDGQEVGGCRNEGSASLLRLARVVC